MHILFPHPCCKGFFQATTHFVFVTCRMGNVLSHQFNFYLFFRFGWWLCAWRAFSASRYPFFRQSLCWCSQITCLQEYGVGLHFNTLFSNCQRRNQNKAWIQCLSLSAEIFTPVCCFIVFNVMDWIGRSITSVFEWVKLQHTFHVILYLNIHAHVRAFISSTDW